MRGRSLPCLYFGRAPSEGSEQLETFKDALKQRFGVARESGLLSDEELEALLEVVGAGVIAARNESKDPQEGETVDV